ncbi:MAG TPA: YjbQ family protein, partial [Rhizomicrobium sp.]|nr:YjbQ family protein [Rhizomicrobium sp.]
MKQKFHTLELKTQGPGLYDFTAAAARFVDEAGIADGLLTCMVRHTSASLLIQENADPDVLEDLEAFMRRIVSRDTKLYRHTTEGP